MVDRRRSSHASAPSAKANSLGSVQAFAAIGALLAAGGILRWNSPGRIALWRDEAQFLAIAELPSVEAVLSFLYQHESHPPLYYLLGHLAHEWVGSAEEPMRWFSLVMSLACIPVSWLIGSQVFGRVAGWIAAAGTALSVPLALFSVQLRPYALISLLILVAHWSLWKLWVEGRLLWAGVWVCALLAGLYVHHLFVLVAAAQFVVAGIILISGVRLNRRNCVLLVAAAVVALIAAIPDIVLLTHQAVEANYPAARPLRLLGPPGALLAIAMTMPFEVLLPILVAATWLLTRLRSGRLVSPDVLVAAGGPMFIILAMAASYRSQFLTPHVLLSVAPIGAVGVGAYIDSLLRRGRRLSAAIWLEGGVVSLSLGFLMSVGYEKTTADLVAAAIRAEYRNSDLVVGVPGPIGASLDRYFEVPVHYFPSQVPISPFAFNNYFEHLADSGDYQTGLEMIRAAYDSGRRVWFVTDARWVIPDLPVPARITEETHGGLGQADRLRVNGFFRYLRATYGPPRFVVGSANPVRGVESLAGWLFERPNLPAGEE